MSKTLLRSIIVLIFVIATILFIIKQDWVFAGIFGIIGVVFILRLVQGNMNDKNK